MKKLLYSPDYREKIIRLRNDLDMKYGRPVREKVFDEINHRLQLLKTQNYLGISLRDMYGVDCDFYLIHISKNVVFYEVGEKEIRILNLYHEREDYIIRFLGSTALQESSVQWSD